jgi:osmotically-inducible protein OsmY
MSTSAQSFSQQDERIRQEVLQQIACQSAIRPPYISVKVTDSHVVLTGYVRCCMEKMAAERAAQSVSGVASVANDIEVKLTDLRTDPEIARDVAQAIMLHSSVPDGKVKVAASDGLVTLEGTLQWEFQRVSAERVASECLGVKGVINMIAIQPCAPASEIKEKIEAALRRSVDLDTRSMVVMLNDGIVSLYGRVHSWPEREQAEDAAWQAPGITHVSNHLLVCP